MSSVASGRVLLVLALAGLLSACARTGSSARLTPDNPTLVVDKTLRVELASDEAGQVEVTRLHGNTRTAPDEMEAMGNLYSVDADIPVQLVVTPPEGPVVDILRWDDERQAWDFVPLAQQTQDAWTVEGSGTIGLFAAADRRPVIATSVDVNSAGQASKTDAMRLVFLEGAVSQADGSLDVSQLAALSSNKSVLLPVATMNEGDLSSLLANDAARKTHIAGLQQMAASTDGAAVAYGPATDEQSTVLQAMIEAAGLALREDDKVLAVRLPEPNKVNEDWTIPGYDAVQIGRLADWVVVELPGGPGDLRPGGLAADYLDWLVTRIDRRKLIPVVSAASIDEWNKLAIPISYDYALAPLGLVGLKLDQPGARVEPGAPLTFGLVGQASNLSRDPATSQYRYDVVAAGEGHHIWLMTASALRQQLDWLSSYAVGGVLVNQLLDAGASPGTLNAVERFSVGQEAGAEEPLMLAWEVQTEDGRVIVSERTALDEPLMWTPDERGEYLVRATLGGSTEVEMGSTSVEVGAPPPTPTPAPGQGTVDGQTVQTGEVGSPTGQNFTVLEGMPEPIFPPGQASFGKFELGGQVNHLIRHPVMMNDAGMTWVKFQLAWQPGQDPSTAWELVSRGREAGFKVLLSIVGSEKRPQDINVPSYLDFLRGVAYYGPEAIEVWNEPNYYFEWPQGQMNGGEYVRRMLAPAYNAIKSVNSNIMVISGAPLPTGAYYGEGGCSSQGYGCDDWLYIQQMAEAGAANYMDCVGVHYNAGATAPSSATGHPADPGYQHYSWYFGGMLQLYAGTFGHPVCFTELGYLSKDGLGELPDNFSWAGKTTVNDQAAWLAEAAQLSRESGQVRLMVVWNVDFVYWGPDDPKAGYAIVRPDGSCPACTTLGQAMP